MDAKKNFQLSIVVIHNEDTNLHTAYLSQFPEVISDGLTEEEALENLIETFKFYLDFKKQEVQLEKKPQNMVIKTVDFKYDFAQ